ncbi:hypothetical protein PGT21_028223 [Puccinia graminis f. sp. tritici]|uniref:DDE Tnp4 domain-containing protein n=1 Tax=Puccinia graminis f. sp. tritici TaxID=56615 RepID=A0A5B0NH50_PUCGR|nr:hypothetical protein PGT21_028223 [Puccinia graminis f. sp. tritici]
MTPGTGAARIIPAGSYLIGDAGYPSNVDILVPYPLVATEPNEWFNFIQSSTRICVEQAFGRLKNQFRILRSAQNARPFRARNNTFVCMILHNILNRRGTLYLHVWDEGQDAHERRFPVPPFNPEAGIEEAIPLNDVNRVSMWVRRDIIRDVLYIA